MRRTLASKQQTGDGRSLALALLAAVAVHSALLGAAYSTRAWRAERAPAAVREHPIDVEISLVETPPEVPYSNEVVARPTEAAPAARARAVTRISPAGEARLSATSGAARPSRAATPEPSAPLAEEEADPTEPPAESMRRPIDLGLEGGYTRLMLLSGELGRPEPSERPESSEQPKQPKQPERPERPEPPSIGLLAEGLAALDAAHGVSRSGAVVHAGYEAARAYAPSEGIAVFDVRADATGAVVSVALVSSGPDEQRWIRVGARLRELLAARRLRVAPGARGLSTRVRIEHGSVARSAAELGRVLDRGAALGQGALPPRAIADESARGSLGPGQVGPVFQVSSSEEPARALHIVVLRERAL